jgi:hypothetical protein
MATRRTKLTYTVDAILGHAGFTFETRKFLVKWKGYGHAKNTFEPFDHVKDCLAFQQYWPNKLTAEPISIVSHTGNKRNIHAMTYTVEWVVKPKGKNWEYFVSTLEPYDNILGNPLLLEKYWTALETDADREGTHGHVRCQYLKKEHQDKRYKRKNALAGTNIRDRQTRRRLPYVKKRTAVLGINEPELRFCATCERWLSADKFRDERVIFKDRGRIRQTIHCNSCNATRIDHMNGFLEYDDGSDQRGKDYEFDPEWCPEMQ